MLKSRTQVQFLIRKRGSINPVTHSLQRFSSFQILLTFLCKKNQQRAAATGYSTTFLYIFFLQLKVLRNKSNSISFLNNFYNFYIKTYKKVKNKASTLSVYGFLQLCQYKSMAGSGSELYIRIQVITLDPSYSFDSVLLIWIQVIRSNPRYAFGSELFIWIRVIHSDLSFSFGSGGIHETQHCLYSNLKTTNNIIFINQKKKQSFQSLLKA